jgi:hypothetical protein
MTHCFRSASLLADSMKRSFTKWRAGLNHAARGGIKLWEQIASLCLLALWIQS